MTDVEDSLAREYRSCIQELFQSINAGETGSAAEYVLQIATSHPEKNKAAHFAALETAFRESFYEILVRLSVVSGYIHKLNTRSLLPQLMTLPSYEYGPC